MSLKKIKNRNMLKAGKLIGGGLATFGFVLGGLVFLVLILVGPLGIDPVDLYMESWLSGRALEATHPLDLNFTGDSCSYLGIIADPVFCSMVVPIIQNKKDYHLETLDDWKIWFIGFSEGDGTLYMRDGRPQFKITQKELEPLVRIQATLGIGIIRFDPSNRVYYMYTFEVSDIFRLYNIFNNRLVIPHRIRQLNAWYPALLKIYPDISAPQQVPVLPTLEDAWFSGLSDAEGSFVSSVGTQIFVVFDISQNDFEAQWEYFKGLLGSGSIKRKTKKVNEVSNKVCWNLAIRAQKTLPVIIDYFTLFPLRTYKVNTFLLWSKIANLIISGDHLTAAGRASILGYKSLMNPGVENSAVDPKYMPMKKLLSVIFYNEAFIVIKEISSIKLACDYVSMTRSILQRHIVANIPLDNTELGVFYIAMNPGGLVMGDTFSLGDVNETPRQDRYNSKGMTFLHKDGSTKKFGSMASARAEFRCSSKTIYKFIKTKELFRGVWSISYD